MGFVEVHGTTGLYTVEDDEVPVPLGPMSPISTPPPPPPPTPEPRSPQVMTTSNSEFRKSSDGRVLGPILATVLSSPVHVRDYSAVHVRSVRLSNAVKKSIAPMKLEPNSALQNALAAKANITSWSFELSASTSYDGCKEQMEICGGSLRRTLHEFAWARSALVAEFPGVIVPPITPEAALGDMTVLDRWLRRCLSHPLVSEAPVLKCFIMAPPSEFVAAQRDFVADGSPPPLSVAASALFIRGEELARDARDAMSASEAKEAAAASAEEEAETSSSSSLEEEDVVYALTDEEVKQLKQWVSEQSRELDHCASACDTASAADARARAAGRAAASAVTTVLSQSGGASSELSKKQAIQTAAAAAAKLPLEFPSPLDDFLLESTPALSDTEEFGPERILARLRDMLGLLSATADAIAGRENARRTLLAAKQNYRRCLASRQSRSYKIEQAHKQRSTETLPPDDSEPTAEGAAQPSWKVHLNVAKGALQSLSLSAASSFNRTTANLESDDAGVERSAALVKRLEGRYKLINERLRAELNQLKKSWVHRLRAADAAYAAGEADRADAAAAAAFGAEARFRIVHGAQH